MNIREEAADPRYQVDAFWISRFGFDSLPPHYDDPRYYTFEQRLFVAYLCANFKGLEDGMALAQDYERLKQEIDKATLSDFREAKVKGVQSDSWVEKEAARTGTPKEELEEKILKRHKRAQYQKLYDEYNEFIRIDPKELGLTSGKDDPEHKEKLELMRKRLSGAEGSIGSFMVKPRKQPDSDVEQ